MSTRIKKPASQIATPRTRAEMESLVACIAAFKRDETDLKNRMDDAIANVKSGYSDAISAVADDMQRYMVAAESWATNPANADEFGKNKSIKFLHGIVGFRTTTPKLEPLSKKWNWKNITDEVAHFLPNFIRNKPEVDREAIIAQREELADALPRCGLRVTQTESFFVEPEITAVEKRV